MDWLRIILFVLRLILEGMSKNEAAERGSRLFNVSAEEILKHL